MLKQTLSEDEIKVIGECIKAAAYGPFFIDEEAEDNPEIHSIFGLTIDELRKIADGFPSLDLEDENVRLAINNTLNNLLGYPHGCSDEVWSKYITVSEDELRKIFFKWKGSNVKNYIDGLM